MSKHVDFVKTSVCQMKENYEIKLDTFNIFNKIQEWERATPPPYSPAPVILYDIFLFSNLGWLVG